MNTMPNYNRIYEDLIKDMFPDKSNELLLLVTKKIENSLDVIELNEQLFKKNNREKMEYNQRLKAYDVESIKAILKYQEDNFLTNSELASLFRLSRNTVTKWKKMTFHTS
ncbi:helix-turn-helix domain-containing protein [Myroides ceti]|jgi:DNA-binding transcriptional regulator YiaG|uniref:Helix-turn-helix domain-containing protein n=1 Tax=Paenimyroides ceti TaxID=395087 RepID=A0ABT8CZF9_9FLAO|nr:helix-turn-helix domain-containing protein [Paenimyroides ceti]MDN3707903.1 helix-turn-helix domain-containing protein [Paenimyroides ceti]MDN3709131.1 helix-turn-helix domain-containing protein [Paenimyroides ceti]